jgi:RNA polymerase sigma factor (sigma-70 family)
MAPRAVRPSGTDSPQAASSDAESSATLLSRARAGDSSAVEQLCARYLPRLRRWAHGRLPPWARGAVDTQDLAQDALVAVVRHVAAFEPEHGEAFQAYVRQALLNRIRDEVRRASRRGTPEPLAEHRSLAPSPLEDAIGTQTLARYEAALNRLTPADQDAIVLRIELGHPYSEVAAALGKPSVAAAHMAVSRALVRLAKEMARDE